MSFVGAPVHQCIRRHGDLKVTLISHPEYVAVYEIFMSELKRVWLVIGQDRRDGEPLVDHDIQVPSRHS